MGHLAHGPTVTIVNRGAMSFLKTKKTGEKHLKEAATLKPGSIEAKHKGCTCEVGEEGQLFINNYCPVHWKMSMVNRTESIYRHIAGQNSTHTTLLLLLIFLLVWILFLQVV